MMDSLLCIPYHKYKVAKSLEEDHSSWMRIDHFWFQSNKGLNLKLAKPFILSGSRG